MAGIGVSSLWCPSDPLVTTTAPYDPDSRACTTSGSWRQQLTSYAGCQGTWGLRLRPSDGSSLPGRIASMNGTVYGYSAVSFAAITDGTSNTLLFGEHGHSLLSQANLNYYQFWNSGYDTDTMFEAYFPPNMQKRNNTGLESGSYSMNASSFHPGGVNFAFVDGSARFGSSRIRYRAGRSTALIQRALRTTQPQEPTASPARWASTRRLRPGPVVR